MKKIFLLLAVLFIAKIQIAQTLVASYPFNGNANDAAGSSNGTVSGATLTNDRFGNANSAFFFNGNADYIGGIASSFPTNDRTISLWFNADAGSVASNTPCPFSYGGDACGSSFLMILNNISNGKYQMQGHCTSNLNEYIYPSAPEANWYNWVVTVNGTTIKMFINGVLVNTTTSFTIPTTVLSKDFYIGTLINNNGTGRFNPSGGYYFKGKIDDIKIYNGALSDAQILDGYLNDFKKPGSGNTASFNGTSQYIEVPDNPGFTFGTSFTASAWIKTTSFDADIFSNFEAAFPFTGTLFGIGFGCVGNISDPRAGRLGFYIGNNASSTSESYNDISGPRIDDNKWHNVAVSYDGSQVRFFVDGVATSVISASNNGIGNSSNVLRIGRDNNEQGVRYFNGSIDELQLWSTALPLNTIRDWMCKKITSTHPAYTNLVSYFRFDEGSTNNTGGFAGNFGTLINTPTWQTSGAALGDASAHDYVNATKTANISHPSGENFAVTSTNGNPEGLQVYRVDEQPNTLTGASGVGVNNKYFGVFQAGGTSPQYTAVYNYNGNPSITPAIESQLRLNKRNDNAASSWIVMPDVANEPANTITVTGQNTEYILGRVGGVLPIKLISFDAVKKGNEVLVNWKATNEEDILYYEVERSIGNNVFTKIYTTAAKNALSQNSYDAKDDKPYAGINYYRLKIVDKEKKVAFSQVVKVIFKGDAGTITISPNPTSNYITVNGTINYTQIQIIDVSGRLVKQYAKKQNNTYVFQNIPGGVYVIKLIGNTQASTYKVIVK